MRTALALGLFLLAGVVGLPRSALADLDDPLLSARLEQIRNDPALSDDPVVLEGLAVQASASRATSVRAEARLVVAEAWLARLHRKNDALGMLRLVADDPAADSLTARLAEREILDTLVGAGHILAAASELRAHESQVDARFAKRVRKLERRVWLRTTAVGEIVVFALLVTLALVRAKRRRALAPAFAALRSFAPAAASFAAFVGVVGGLLASQFEAGSAAPFLLLGAAALPLLLLARAWSAVGAAAAPARVGRGIVCAASALAAAFVLLEHWSPVYLEGFGL